jgi:predicted ester cyclase
MSNTLEIAATTEQNMALFRKLIEDGFNRGDAAAVYEIVAPHAAEHQPGLQPGPDGLMGAIQFLRATYTDFSLTVEDIVADGDKVWARLRGRGIHTGPLMGHPPTGRHFEIDVIDVCRFADGKLVEHWGVPDRFSLLTQLGLLSYPAVTLASTNARQQAA